MCDNDFNIKYVFYPKSRACITVCMIPLSLLVTSSAVVWMGNDKLSPHSWHCILLMSRFFTHEIKRRNMKQIIACIILPITIPAKEKQLSPALSYLTIPARKSVLTNATRLRVFR